jgi:F-type H+-transporting ATPase subunit b
MDATLQALVGLLIRSIPTILIFIALVIYLNAVYFRPVARIMRERREQTEGVRKLAQEAFESADKKTEEFERALHLARIQIGQENEALRLKWTEEQRAEVEAARAEAEKKIEAARASVAEEIERTKLQMDMNVEALSTSIVESLMRRRAA